MKHGKKESKWQLARRVTGLCKRDSRLALATCIHCTDRASLAERLQFIRLAIDNGVSLEAQLLEWLNMQSVFATEPRPPHPRLSPAKCQAINDDLYDWTVTNALTVAARALPPRNPAPDFRALEDVLRKLDTLNREIHEAEHRGDLQAEMHLSAQARELLKSLAALKFEGITA